MATPVLTLLYQPFSAIIDALVLDASIKEEHIAEVEVTDHPVEQGAAVTDHARPKPEEVTIEGVVSNTPLNHFQTLRAESRDGYTWQTSAAVNSVRGMPGAAESAYQQLRDLRDKPRLVTIVTALRTYDSMVMTSLKVPRDSQIGDVLRFEAKFKQVRVVTNAVTVVATKVNKTKPQQKLGSKPTTTVAASTPIGGPNYRNLVTQATGTSGSPFLTR
jgi:hypothetical protein